jgi:hypothetical protein
MSSSKDEINFPLTINYRSTQRFKNLKKDQDKESNCPRLPVLTREVERVYNYYTNEEITYLDYTYCVNETKLPVIRTLHSDRTLFRVSFYTETRVVNIDGWYSNTFYLTEKPRDRFTFSYKLSRGTFPIDHFVFHKREIPAYIYKKRAYTDNDPRYFAKEPTYEEWFEKIHRCPASVKVTFQEQWPTGNIEDDHELFSRRSYGNPPYTRTCETFDGHIRTAKKQKTVLVTQSTVNDYIIQKGVIKRAPTWNIDSAFDTTLNPFLHVSIYYFLISDWSERK